MAALDSVGDYEADPNVMLEDVPQDIVIKTLKVSCACVPVLVFACVWFLFVCVHATGKQTGGRTLFCVRAMEKTSTGFCWGSRAVIPLEVTMTVSAGGPIFCFVVLLKSL
jgi:hypothetical protein